MPPIFPSAPVRRRQGLLHECVLLLAVLAAVAAVCTVTWWQNLDDRTATMAESTLLAEALTEAIDNHLDAALRDAGNAALSAAMLIEQSGGIARMGGQERLHRELKRELWDERTTARLLLVDTADQVLASSAEVPLPRGLLAATPAARWESSFAGGRSFWVGEPQRSRLDGRWVIPYWCDVLGPDGQATGRLRAELHVEGLLRHYRSLDKLHGAVIAVYSNDGLMMMRNPFVEGRLGTRNPVVHETLDRSARQGGSTLTDAGVDRVPRLVAWRRMGDYPLVVLVGMDRRELAIGWGQRSSRRGVIAALACVAIVLLGAALLLYLRRLAASRSHADAVEARYWSAMESSTSGIAVASMAGEWQHANSALLGILDCRPGDLLLPPSRRPVLLQVVQQRIRQVAWPAQAGEFCVSRAEGDELWLHVQTALLRDGTGEPSSTIVHVQDITARKQSVQALRMLNEELEHRVRERTEALSRANQDLEAFAHSAAHDLRGPLDRLGAFVDVLCREIGPALAQQPARRIASIHRQLGVMTALIDKLLAFSRLSRAALRPVPVDVGELVLDIVQELEDSIGERRAWFSIGLLPKVQADRDLLREALANLLGNALKYTRGQPVARIAIDVADGGPGEACITIRDNGAGFDMAFAADLFTPFKRLHGATEFEGSGIGLSIVHRIIERSGGRVWARGAPAQGAQFWFTLPAAH